MGASLPSVTLGVLALAAGCAHKLPQLGTELVTTQRYGFELSTDIETALFGLDGEPLDQPAPPPTSLRWEGRLEQSAARRFRDGSQGDRVRFLEVTLDEAGAGPAPSDLSGLSVELRSFGDREILAIDSLDRIVGPGRQGDLMLGLWPALSPSAPELEPGQRVRHRGNLPFMLDNGMGIPLVLELDWTLEGEEACGPHRCWRLSFEGPVRGKGLDRSERWHARYRASGSASGAVLMEKEGLGLQRSELRLELELTTILSDPASQAPRGSIRQTWHQQVELHREEEAP